MTGNRSPSLKVFKSFQEKEEFDRQRQQSLTPQQRIAEVEEHRKVNYGYFDRTFSTAIRTVKSAWS